MKKRSKEMLETIISNQELIMKTLEIEIPQDEAKKTPAKKATVKKSVRKNV